MATTDDRRQSYPPTQPPSYKQRTTGGTASPTKGEQAAYPGPTQLSPPPTAYTAPVNPSRLSSDRQPSPSRSSYHSEASQVAGIPFKHLSYNGGASIDSVVNGENKSL